MAVKDLLLHVEEKCSDGMHLSHAEVHRRSSLPMTSQLCGILSTMRECRPHFQDAVHT